jgi:uncharacterized protein (TIGR02246 family)
MKKHWSMTVVAVCCLAFFALQCNPKPVPDTRAADEATIRGINPAWFKAYNAGDANGLVALYAEDAVVSAPGVPAARGHNAIRALFMKDVAASAAAGVTLHGGPTTDVGVSGDLGWESGTFTVTDKSGATVDTGKYVSVFGRKDGKWLILRDIWNTDGPMQTPKAKK